jgi:DNA polymerase
MREVSMLYPSIVMHVHDEMIVEVAENQAKDALDFMQHCMSLPLAWAPGLLLRGDGYLTKYYRKD